MQKAVIDRIVDGKQAVLLIGDQEVEKIIPVEKLPEDATEGTWLKLHSEGQIEIDDEETKKVKSRIKDKMALLRSRNKSKFKK